MDKRIQFDSHNTNLLPPKPKSSFRHLKQGIQEFHRTYVFVPADKAANNIVVVYRLHYINTSKQEINGTKAYEEFSTDEKTLVLQAIEYRYRYKIWSCQNVCYALSHLLDNIYIRLCDKLYRQIVGIPMGTNCAPLVSYLFLFCY